MNRAYIKNIFAILAFFALCAIITSTGLSKAVPWVMTLIFFFGTAALLYFIATPYFRDENDPYVFWLSYLAKLVYAVYSFFAKFGVSLAAPKLSKDAFRFWRDASVFLKGESVVTDTRFPIVLSFEFRIFGQNILCVLMLNIFLTMLMMIVIMKLLNHINVHGTARLIAIAIAGFAPYEIIAVCSILREPIYFAFITLSFYVYYLYIQNGKFYCMLIALALLMPVLLLHTGYFPIIVAYFIDSFRYDRPKTKLDLFKRLFILIALVVAVVFIMQMDNGGAGYFDRGISGLINRATGEAGEGYADEAGSRYLESMNINSVPELILYTPIRGFFFLFSPLPTNWRGLTDIITFFADSCVQFFVLYTAYQARSILKKRLYATKNREYSDQRRLLSIGLTVILLVALLFGLNTNNAGTAIRHRDTLIGIEAIMLGLSLKIRKEKYTL